MSRNFHKEVLLLISSKPEDFNWRSTFEALAAQVPKKAACLLGYTQNDRDIEREVEKFYLKSFKEKGGKVYAVKYLKDKTGMGLKEAKDRVEEIWLKKYKSRDQSSDINL